MRRRILGSAAAVAVLVTLAWLVAFRTEAFLSDLSPSEWEADRLALNMGRPLLSAAQRAHGSEVRRRSTSIAMKVRHQVKLPYRAALLGLPASPARYTLTTTFGEAESTRLVFEGSTAEVQLDGEQPAPSGLAWLRDLLEIPFSTTRLASVERLAPSQWRGRTYDRVFATADDLRPSATVDQAVLWMDADTHRVDRMDATFREIAPFSVVRVEWTWSQRPSGLVVPDEIEVWDTSIVPIPVMSLRVEGVDVR